MSFFDDASLAFLPSGAAGKDGKAYSIKPVPEYGAELITNGDFATDTGWNKGAGWSISSGTANCNGTTTTLVSNIPITPSIGKTGKLRFEITNYVSGKIALSLNGTGGSDTGTLTPENGFYEFDLFGVMQANSTFITIYSTAFIGSIDNVSVKEVLVGDGDFTFSRGSNLSATRVGADGLIEKGRENLLTYSNDFSNAAWAKSSVSVTSGQSGYDGSSNAWLLDITGGTSSQRLEKSVSQSGVQTASIYAKAGTRDWIRFRLNTSGTAAQSYFDLANGALGVTYSGLIDRKIEDVGGGWYRCSISFNSTSNLIRIYPAEANGDVTHTSGSIYIQSAQLEIGLAATEVISTGATTGKAGLLENEPRFDYSGDCPSLLLEPSRTQLIEQSEYFDGSYWTKDRVTISNNDTTSPEGKLNASKIIEDSQNGVHRIFCTISGQNNVLSFFAKADERQWVAVLSYNSSYSYFNVGDGTLGTIASGSTATIEDYGNGWYRCSLHNFYTANAIINITTGNGAAGYQGDGTSGLYIYGIQVEAASYPTSYIPNHSGGTITRGADVCGNAGDVNTFNSTEGVLYLEASAIDNGSSEKGLALNDGSTNNRINIRIVNNFIRAYGVVGGSLVCLMTYTAPSVTSINKIAFKYKENDFALWVNGVERVTDNSGAIFPANTLNELSFDYGGASAFFYGNVKQVLTFNTALSDADLATLTTI